MRYLPAPLTSAGLVALWLTSASTTGCAKKASDTGPDQHGTSISLSRIDGVIDHHFSALAQYESDWVTDPVWYAYPLPPGLAIDRDTGEISGTATAAGHWTVKLMMRDRTRGTESDPTPWRIESAGYPDAFGWYSETFELAVYDRLEE